jgi:dTDP-4-amino-4,6-dideoxygalactose transaminase
VIPILDLTRQYQAIKPDLDAAIAGVLESGTFINGPNVSAFESEIASYTGTSHGVGVNSGTDALHLALRALDIGPGDEVITTPFSFIATTEAIGMVGATPVFADIDPMTYTIDPAAIEAAITPHTCAIVPVHLYGLPAAMDAIVELAQRHGLAIVEDCAQSIGAAIGDRRTGSIGTIGAFSFFPSKNLGAYGDGGMVVTNDANLATRVRRLRAHGAAVKYYHDELGVNSRLDELQAAILRVKLRHLDAWIEARQAAAERYDSMLEALPGIEAPIVPQGMRHVYHQYTVRLPGDRDRTAKELRERGVQTMVYYPVPLHLQPVHAALGLGDGSFPHSERAAREVLSLPMFPELRPDESKTVVEMLEQSTALQAPVSA